MSIEAMKLALRSIRELVMDESDDAPHALQGVRMRKEKAITALRLAIEQAEKQEPYLKREVKLLRQEKFELINQSNILQKRIAELKEQSKQEPVAFRTVSHITRAVGYWSDRVPDYIDADSWEITPLYTSPPQRQPLTDDEISALRREVAALSANALDDHKMIQSLMAERQPLTDEQIADLWDETVKYAPSEVRIRDFARAIEAAHGIKGKA